MTIHSPPPPEWAQQSSVWIGWPSAPDLWEEHLLHAQGEVAALVQAIAETGQAVDLVVSPEPAIGAAKAAFASFERVRLHMLRMGDIWLRDTGPIFAHQASGRLSAHRFRFNGWGGKYTLDGDETIGDEMARLAGAETHTFDAVLEGGAVDWDGEGHVLTTRQCLLNPNRNPGWTEADAEAFLRKSLDAQKVIWLGNGLVNDHTDGHVDNLARFIAPGVIACQTPVEGDPNADVLRQVEADLRAARDTSGALFQIVTIPSPGLVTDAKGQPAPASHMNFLITNAVVIVPTYGTASADAAIEALKPHFPGRDVIGLPARHILSGGGAFHCISQQQPAPPRVESR